MKTGIAVAALMSLALAFACPMPAGADEPAAKPNFVVIFCDDLGYGDLGCYGRMQELAEQAVARLGNDEHRGSEQRKAKTLQTSAPMVLGATDVRLGVPEGR